MICKMFTINGKAPTIGNTALTGSAIGNPGVVLEYFNTGNNTPHYDGFSVRVAKSGTTATIDYENMCYYSTAKYDNPDPSQLTKAFFFPMSQLRYLTDPDYNFKCLAAGTWYPWIGEPTHSNYGYIFPCDEDDYDHAGAYVIPTAEYAGQNLYVYVWLPDVLQSPENKDQVGLDCTVLKTKAEEIGVNIHKCDMPGLNKFCFNQAYVKSAINCDFSTSAHQYFGFGDIIDNAALSPIELMSGCDIRQYLTGQTIDSAYDSKFYGFPSANYVENCDISGQDRYVGNADCGCYVQSALNSKLHCVDFKSANNCDIYVDIGLIIGSAFNSKLTINEWGGNANSYLNNCTASGLIHNDLWLTAEDSYITSNYLRPQNMQGHYKNTYVTYTADPQYSGTYYAEDYPTKPFVKI